MAKVAVLGYGTVGSGVVEVLSTNHESIREKAEQPVEVKYVLDLKDFPGTAVEKLITHDFNDILEDDDVEVIAEVMGGIEPAYTFVKQALEHGKSVCTSNKELVAKHGPELLETAKKNHVNFLFEASVGGGIPIIRPLNTSLTADEIYEITGILNGTTNFILTKMKDENLDFDVVLKEAQDLGYAERNPEADVEGYDACRKIAILASLAFGKHVDFEDIYTEGITKISKTDMLYANKMHYEIKLLGRCKRVGDQVCSLVTPMMIGKHHPLSNVHGVFNGILVKGNVIGDVMFYGAGAGKLPTASAVVADMVDAIKHKGKNIITKWSTTQKYLMPIEEVMSSCFVRVETLDKVGSQTVIEELFGKVSFIDIESLHEEIGFVTEALSESDISMKLEKLSETEPVGAVINMIRIDK